MKALFIGYVWPEPLSSAAGIRTWNLLEALLQGGWEVTFASPSQTNGFTQSLEKKGIQTASIQANDSAFDVFIKDLNPSLVIFDRFVIEEQFGWRVHEVCPNALRILDTQDLHFLRRARQRALEGEQPIQLISEDTYREIASIYRCDLTLVISDFEYNLLVNQFQIPQELLLLQRFSYRPAPAPRSFQERSHMVMIGNFRHPPNRDGLIWFKNHIWPLIRKEIPDLEVHLYGAYPSKEIMALTHRATGFIVKGPALDQYETLSQYRVNLAPLRFGAGIKGKISDGWWCGTPAISTSIGAEGMHEDFPFGGCIADHPQEFAQHASELYTNDELWLQHQNHGLSLIEKLYSSTQSFLARVQSIYDHLQTHREMNFMGQLFSFHGLRSTKYFSRWIEEKSKRLSSEKSHN